MKLLEGYNLPQRGRRLRGFNLLGSAFSVSFTGLSSDSLGTYGQIGNHAAISYTITPDNGTETVKWSNSANPADAATYGTGASPTDFAASSGSPVYLHVTDGGETVTRSFAARYAPGSFAALTAQTYTDDTGNQTYTHAAATGTGLTWTYAATGLISGVTYNPATRTFTIDTNALAVQSGTNAGSVSATDQYGRPATGSPRSLTLTIQEAPVAVNPVISTATFTAGGSGTPASLDVTGTYAGADDPLNATLEFFEGVTLRATASVTGLTVTGGNFDFSGIVIDPATLVYEAGSSAADLPNVDSIDVTIFESTNGGSATATAGSVTGLDGIPPAFASATTDSGGTVITVTTSPDETLFGTPVTAQATVNVNGSPVTVNSVAIVAGKLTLTLAAAVSNGDTITASYTNATEAVVDAQGNPLAAFSGQAVTNAVPAPAGLTVTYLGSNNINSSSATVTDSGVSLGTGTIIIGVHSAGNVSQAITSVQIGAGTPVTAALSDGVNTALQLASGDRMVSAFFAVPSSVATGDVTVNYGVNPGATVTISRWLVEGSYSVTDVEKAFSGSNVTAPWTRTLNLSTVSGGAAFVGMATRSGANFDGAANFTTRVNSTAGGNRARIVGDVLSPATETRAVTIADADDTAWDGLSMVAVSIEEA